MIIPKYLRDIAKIESNKENRCLLSIHCSCGCNKFFLYKNIIEKQKITKEDRKRIKETEKWEDEILSPLITNYDGVGPKNAVCYLDHPKEKYRELIIYDYRDLNRKFDFEKDKERIVKVFRVNYGEIPLSMKEVNAIYQYDDSLIIKAMCSKCNNEYVLFDSRIHGCDAADFSVSELKKYNYKEIKIKGIIGKSYKVKVYIDNYWDIEDCLSLNDNLTVDDYSNMFNYIKIQAIDEENKKVSIYSDELG